MNQSAHTSGIQHRILGVDPGLRITGYAILDTEGRKPVLCEGGVIRSQADRPLEQRISEIYNGLQEVVHQFHPGVMALEQLFSSPKHPRTAILMAHVRGAICLTAAQAAIPIIHYSPTRLKKLLTGNGRASKSQMQHAVKEQLSLDRTPKPADVADAIALALCHYHCVGTAIPQNTVLANLSASSINATSQLRRNIS